MSDRYGIDLGNVLSTVEDIKSARLTNKFNAIKLASAEQDQADQNALRTTQADKLTSPQNPTGSPGVQTFLDGLDEKSLGDALKANDATLRAFHYVETSDDPGKAWLDLKESLPPDAQKDMPATYDPEWLKAHQGKAYLLQQQLEAKAGMSSTPDKVTPYTDAAKIQQDLKNGLIDQGQAQDALAKLNATDNTKDAPSGYQWADANHTSLVPVPGGPKDPKAGGQIDVTAANSIRGAVVSAFGGTYDPVTFGFSGLDPERGKRAVDVMALAEDFYAKGDNPANAVKKAMEQMGGPAAGGDHAGTEDDPATPADPAAFDALPAGAFYIDPGDQQLYQK